MKKILIVSVIINLLFIARYLQNYYWQHYQKGPYVTYSYDRDKLFEVLGTDTTDIVFLGNSIIQHFELYELLKNQRVRNRGIGRETTAGALNRLPVIIQGNPSKVFILLGINDLGKGFSVENIIKKYTEIIQQLSDANIKCYVISVLPVLKRKEEVVCCPLANQKIIALNAELDQLTNRFSNITYIHLHNQFFDGKGMVEQYTVDGVHLSGEGYKLFAEAIIPYL